MSDLERDLMRLAEVIDWPATPAFKIAEHRQRRGHRRLVVVLTALAALLGGAMAVEPARSAILEFFGLRGARIERRAPVATPRPIPPDAPLGTRLDLGARVKEVHGAGFAAAPPGAGLGPPDATFLDTRSALGARVAYVYAARPGLPRAEETGAGLLVTEFAGTVEPIIQKAAGPGTTIERLTIGGERAYWLAGRPHGFAFMHEGSVDYVDQRLAGPTLLFEHDGLLIRIEGRISRARAVGIAASITAHR
ncbi:MAG: hypothetical protein QOF76_4242 [Solirubrobacteraceae bacterium]|nr:hypothetical protein [Solirubrobacteraceae bacterium]